MVSRPDFEPATTRLEQGPQPARWRSTELGLHLRGRKNADTSAELALRRALHGLGRRFRLQRRITPSARADIVFPGPRIAVFVDGCFWHGCPRHGRSTFSGPNAALWVQKLERNRRRDARALEEGAAHGWRVIRLWECGILENAVAAVDVVLRALADVQARPRR